MLPCQVLLKQLGKRAARPATATAIPTTARAAAPVATNVKGKKPQRHGYTKEFPPPPGSLAEPRPKSPPRSLDSLKRLPKESPDLSRHTEASRYKAEVRQLRRSLEHEHLRNEDRDRQHKSARIMEAKRALIIRKHVLRKSESLARPTYSDALSPSAIFDSAPAPTSSDSSSNPSTTTIDMTPDPRRIRMQEKRDFEARLRLDSIISLVCSAKNFVTHANLNKKIDEFLANSTKPTISPLKDLISTALDSSAVQRPRTDVLNARLEGTLPGQPISVEKLQAFEIEEAAMSGMR